MCIFMWILKDFIYCRDSYRQTKIKHENPRRMFEHSVGAFYRVFQKNRTEIYTIIWNCLHACMTTNIIAPKLKMFSSNYCLSVNAEFV